MTCLADETEARKYIGGSNMADKTFKGKISAQGREITVLSVGAKHGEIEPLARSFRASCAHK